MCQQADAVVFVLGGGGIAIAAFRGLPEKVVPMHRKNAVAVVMALNLFKISFPRVGEICGETVGIGQRGKLSVGVVGVGFCVGSIVNVARVLGKTGKGIVNVVFSKSPLSFNRGQVSHSPIVWGVLIVFVSPYHGING